MMCMLKHLTATEFDSYLYSRSLILPQVPIHRYINIYAFFIFEISMQGPYYMLNIMVCYRSIGDEAKAESPMDFTHFLCIAGGQ